MPDAAVITADIVNSTQLTKTQEKKLFQQLETVINPNKFEFYRGDSFQVYMKEPDETLKLLLKLRLEARKLGSAFDIRASIGIGEVNLPVKKLSVATGEAFVLSGRGMDELAKGSERKMLIHSSGKNDSSILEVTSLFIDYIFREMTSKQARVLSLLLDGATQMAVAKKIRKSQSTIHQHVQSSGWSELTKLLAIYQQLYK
ncbi:MAG: hypothetical protein ABWZ25_02955 [Chitinophagaceae bacterium]